MEWMALLLAGSLLGEFMLDDLGSREGSTLLETSVKAGGFAVLGATDGMVALLLEGSVCDAGSS